MKANLPRYGFTFSLGAAILLSVGLQAKPCPAAQAGQKELLKMTVGYTPIAGATLRAHATDRGWPVISLRDG
jgi:hypothetical protein